jgi:hypothetical protein
MEIDLEQERVKIDNKWYTIKDLKKLIKEKIEAEELDIQKYTNALKDLKTQLEKETVITIKLPQNIFNKFSKKADEVSQTIEDFLKETLINTFGKKDDEPAKKEEEPDDEDLEFEIEEIDEDEEDKEPIKEIPCPRCKSKVPIYTEERPLDIECPNCGKKGTLKK